MNDVSLNHVYNMDALELLKSMADASVNCIVTSPPYFGLRDYGVDGQIGLEETPAAYVAALVAVFHEARRVLRDDGTLWLNLGDSYVGATSQHKGVESQGHNSVVAAGTYAAVPENGRGARNKALYASGLGMKQLIGIPWRVAFALQDDGWILRSDIIWSKPNAMPESVKDRPTKAHEYIFLLTKCPDYWYDAEAIKEPTVDGDPAQPRGGEANARLNGGRRDKQGQLGNRRYTGFNERWDNRSEPLTMRNKRSVWTVSTAPFPGAHFATFPEALIEPCILAGCPKDGLVLDPFFGAGTVGLVAQKHGRNWIGSEINPEYVELARARIAGRLEEYQAAQAGQPFTHYLFDVEKVQP